MFKIIIVVVAIVLVALFFQRSRSNSKDAAENARLGAEFLQTNGARTEVSTTESGLQYEILQEGSGTMHPAASATVKVHYHGTLIDGSVFDSSVERNSPIEFALDRVIEGWTEGLQLMVVGEKRRFYIPSDLAYGDSSTGGIAAGSTLIFDVELLSIVDD